MKTFVEKCKVIAQIKEAMQWYNAILKKAENEVKWYEKVFLPFSKNVNICYRAERRVCHLEELLNQASYSETKYIELDEYSFDQIYVLKSFEEYLEES